mmetsp:Transcript_6074/g.20444  ORF Transcript_6074/g.20444 Transcript_6074/m.20444 type:complete len:202 (+) Transcript_6074:945-1550(+)
MRSVHERPWASRLEVSAPRRMSALARSSLPDPRARWSAVEPSDAWALMGHPHSTSQVPSCTWRTGGTRFAVWRRAPEGRWVFAASTWRGVCCASLVRETHCARMPVSRYALLVATEDCTPVMARRGVSHSCSSASLLARMTRSPLGVRFVSSAGEKSSMEFSRALDLRTTSCSMGMYVLILLLAASRLRLKYATSWGVSTT